MYMQDVIVLVPSKRVDKLMLIVVFGVATVRDDVKGDPTTTI